MSLYQLFKANGPSGFGYGSTAEEVTGGVSLAGKTILVTGCNAGLGQETLRVLTLRGARVVGTARTLEKAEAACAAAPGQAVPLACELSDPPSVRACVAAVERAGLRLDAIVCNAGIMALPKLRHMHPLAGQVFGLVGPLALKSVAQGAATQIYAAVHPGMAGTSGACFADCNLATPRADADDPALAARLWEATERIVAGLPTG